MSISTKDLINLVQKQKKNLKIQLKEKKRKLSERNNSCNANDKPIKKK